MKSKAMQTKYDEKKTFTSKFLDLILPTTGVVCYECFSVNIMNPKKFTGLFGSRTIIAADVLWFNAHIGFGIYLYRQNFLQAASTPWKITYSVFGSALFNFGSVLLWGTSKALLPKVPGGIKVLFGLASGLALMYIGWHLTDFLNTEVSLQKKQT